MHDTTPSGGPSLSVTWAGLFPAVSVGAALYRLSARQTVRFLRRTALLILRYSPSSCSRGAAMAGPELFTPKRPGWAEAPPRLIWTGRRPFVRGAAGDSLPASEENLQS